MCIRVVATSGWRCTALVGLSGSSLKAQVVDSHEACQFPGPRPPVTRIGSPPAGSARPAGGGRIGSGGGRSEERRRGIVRYLYPRDPPPSANLFTSSKVSMATPHGRRLGYHTPEQVSNPESLDSRPCELTTTLLGGISTSVSGYLYLCLRGDADSHRTRVAARIP